MDFYVLLGVGPEATLGDIKRAFRRLARKLHPDINPGDRVSAARFRQIAEAYETLSDPDRRRQYDASGGAAAGSGERTFGFDGFDFSASVSGASAPTFGDLFAEILQQRESPRERATPERGVDLHVALTLGFEEAMRGGERQVSVTRQERCRRCRGAGRLRTVESRCTQCQGAATIRSTRGHMVFSKPCPACRGTGRQSEMACPSCGGRQTEMRADPLTIVLPPGLADGGRVRVPGKGHAGRNGGEAGDLVVTVTVLPHPLFRREGNDLHLRVPLAIHEAALGAKIEVPSLDGPVRLRVLPGTQSGQRYRLRERGVPAADGGHGDLVVEVHLVLPAVLDERSRELLRDFGRLHEGDDVRREIWRASGGELRNEPGSDGRPS